MLKKFTCLLTTCIALVAVLFLAANIAFAEVKSPLNGSFESPAPKPSFQTKTEPKFKGYIAEGVLDHWKPNKTIELDTGIYTSDWAYRRVGGSWSPMGYEARYAYGDAVLDLVAQHDQSLFSGVQQDIGTMTEGEKYRFSASLYGHAASGHDYGQNDACTYQIVFYNATDNVVLSSITDADFPVALKGKRSQIVVAQMDYTAKKSDQSDVLRLIILPRNLGSGKVTHTGIDNVKVSTFSPSSKLQKPIKTLLYFGLYTQWYGIDKALDPDLLQTVNARTDGAKFIPTKKEISAFDVVVMSDVNHASIKDSGLAVIDSFVKKGGGLLVLGGPFTYGAGKYKDSIFPDMLPIKMTGDFDLKRKKKGLAFSKAKKHVILKDVDLSSKPRVYWIHEAKPKKSSVVILRAGSMPLLVLETRGKGRVATFLGTPMGMAAKGQLPFWEWKDWNELMYNTLVWLAKK
jgi:uncharacterized membrane protein